MIIHKQFKPYKQTVQTIIFKPFKQTIKQQNKPNHKIAQRLNNGFPNESFKRSKWHKHWKQ